MSVSPPARFDFARTPNILFGSGRFNELAPLIRSYGNTVLLVTGESHLQQTPHWQPLLDDLNELKITTHQTRVSGEPSPEFIDKTVAAFKNRRIDVVAGIGGGSVMDAAKAIAGLLQLDQSVMDFLEGVGPELPYNGPATPLIAVPTTAGTGSEATKNAVLGTREYKKSFRHELLIAEYALLDPALLASCPAEQIAANGMDALTQLMESFISTRSNPMTDALAISGLCRVRDSLPAWYQYESAAPPHCREDMAYAALQSGICLAQTGLGSVHGLAAPLGAFFPIPHGVACGMLVAACTQANIEIMLKRDKANPALDRYATVAATLSNHEYVSNDEARTALLDLLFDWTAQMKLPRLSDYGVTASDFDHIIANCRGNSMKTNPVELSDEEVRIILQNCL